MFSCRPVKVYKKVVKFSFKWQKIFWVLVLIFMYLDLVDATDRSKVTKTPKTKRQKYGMNETTDDILSHHTFNFMCFSLFWPRKVHLKVKIRLFLTYTLKRTSSLNFFEEIFYPARTCQKWPRLHKGQLNSEWIYEVIVSPKIPTKNYQDFCPGSLLEGRAEILVFLVGILGETMTS